MKKTETDTIQLKNQTNQGSDNMKGWEIKKLGEVCEYDKAPNKKIDLPYVGLEDIQSNTGLLIGSLKPRSVKSLTFRFTNEHVLYGRLRPYLNKVLLPDFEGHCSTEIFPIKPKKGILDRTYLFHWLISNETMTKINATWTGATLPRANMNSVLDFSFIIPSLSEQRRIVSILDEAFAAIARAKANAEQNLKNAKELFESYLQGVFENGNWEKKELREITTILGDGLHGTPKYSVDGDYYFINGNNLNDGRIGFKENTKRVNVNEFNKYKKILTDRTVLVSINGTLGNVAFYNGEKIILGKSACYFNLKDSVDKGFVKYVLSSPYFINYAHREATGATIKNVSLKSMREFRVPLPTIQEQQTIVRQLDALRAETKRLEAIYQQKLLNLEQLKKSVLQKAFNGELTGRELVEPKTEIAEKIKT